MWAVGVDIAAISCNITSYPGFHFFKLLHGIRCYEIKLVDKFAEKLTIGIGYNLCTEEQEPIFREEDWEKRRSAPLELIRATSDLNNRN